MLADQAPTVRLFALFTARLEFETAWPTHSHVTSLMLTRLTRRQTEEMVLPCGWRQIASGGSRRADRSQDRWRPLFVEELTKMMLESGLLRLEDDHYQLTGSLPPLAIPATLQDSLTARLDRLRACEGNGTTGRDARPRVSIRGPQGAVATVDESVLQRDLARLVDAEFLYQRGTEPEVVYIFKHALIQDAAYQSLLRVTRAQSHERIAQRADRAVRQRGGRASGARWRCTTRRAAISTTQRVGGKGLVSVRSSARRMRRPSRTT